MSEKISGKFEQSLKKLEKIVETLSGGDKGLDVSVELYKEGLELSKKCYQQLQRAEKEVTQLIETPGETKEIKFE